MSAKKEIMDTILKMSGAHSPYNIFTDWIEMCALSIQNLLGHEQIDTTQIYLDISDEELMQAHKKYVI